MEANLFIIFLAAASLYVLSSPRHALILLLMAGFGQDMVRKLTPGEPIIFIVTSGILFAAILLGIWARRGFIESFEPFLLWTDRLRDPLMLFLFILFAQLAYSILLYGNLIVGFIGLTAYLAPFLGVIVGYALANSIDGIRAFLKLYAVIGTAVAITVAASFSGVDWQVFVEVGAGLKIYDQGTILRSHSGIMRTGEIAAWHIASAACLIFTLAVTSKRSPKLLTALLIVALMMVAVSLTGRRKMIMLTVIFLFGYFVSLMYYRRALDSRVFFSIFGVLVFSWFAYETVTLDNYSDSLRNYIARGSSVFDDASGRFRNLGINPVQWAYQRVGLFGGGLGIASQGSYLFNIGSIAGGSGEGGLGKIMVELGLPGLFAVAWLAIALAKHVDHSLRLSLQPAIDPRLLPLMLSISVLLACNAITFSVATQVYGDIFILTIMGVFGGFVFALPKIAALSLQKPRRGAKPLASSSLNTRQGFR